MFAHNLGLVAITCSLISSQTLADDSQINPVARNIKAKIERKVSEYDAPLTGYCDFTIEMKHEGKFAYIKRIRTSGDAQLCKVGKKSLKKGMRFHYQEPEKFIRVQIVEN
ncbi:hypothetical protein [Vibrio tapetis]|uniref:Uncharacterized protein n=1 Tax=Vibrio tapetis subsp. tapetis TaxID=1671868 RepID=A0A2N8Z9L0_9VIBR|nr:hypothetical protein [Vibrio tapetis]SON48601.1 conserved exported protein of unknown function [Vibrio tapetis subsp. tapetis]